MKLLIVWVIMSAILIHSGSAWLFSSSGSGSSRNTGHIRVGPNDKQSQSALTQLYNRPVTKLERYERPLEGGTREDMTRGFGSLNLNYKHEGVVATLDNGERYLVHKGDGFGKKSQTVVTDVSQRGSMSTGWQRTETKPVSGVNVGDLVKAGGKGYIIAGNNCQDGADRMMGTGK